MLRTQNANIASGGSTPLLKSESSQVSFVKGELISEKNLMCVQKKLQSSMNNKPFLCPVVVYPP